MFRSCTDSIYRGKFHNISSSSLFFSGVLWLNNRFSKQARNLHIFLQNCVACVQKTSGNVRPSPHARITPEQLLRHGIGWTWATGFNFIRYMLNTSLISQVFVFFTAEFRDFHSWTRTRVKGADRDTLFRYFILSLPYPAFHIPAIFFELNSALWLKFVKNFSCASSRELKEPDSLSSMRKICSRAGAKN